MRYFFKEAAGAPLRVNGQLVYFEIIGHSGGSVQGVLSASDDTAKEVEKIAERYGIKEITEDQFNELTGPRRNATYTRAVDAMQPVIPQPGQPPVKKAAPEPIKADPRSVVKVGKAS